MPECTTQLNFEFHPDKDIDVRFDAPQSSSDGGVLLLRRADDRIGLTRWLAGLLDDRRDPVRIEHDRAEQVRQRVYQIALGWEDCNDADTLRHDPLLKVACDRDLETPGLSSQPTLSRFENSMTLCCLKQVVTAFEDSYVASIDRWATEIVLDIDSTDDPTHGNQQLSLFNGFHQQYMYHPLLVFDGGTGQLVTALIREGNAHASSRAVQVLERLIRKIKRRAPQATVLIRADAGFSGPDLLQLLDSLNDELGGVRYLVSFPKNAVVLRFGSDELNQAAQEYEDSKCKARVFGAFEYEARSWAHERRVVIKAEHSALGPNPRFVLTNFEHHDPEALYDRYCLRGQCENMIKDLKNALAADRLSCSSFLSNAFRLILHACAYRLLHALREALAGHAPSFAKMQFDTLRLKLLKVAALVSESRRRFLVRLPTAYPHRNVWRALMSAMPPPASA